MILLDVIRMSEHPLTSKFGIGSKSQNFAGQDFRVFRMLSLDTCSKEDRTL